MQRFFELVSQKALVTLAVILGITAFLAPHLTKLRIDTSIMRMLVEDLPAKQEYDRYREEFGGAADAILVVFKGSDVFSQGDFEKIRALTRKDIQRVARTWLDPNRMIVLVVGDERQFDVGTADWPWGRVQAITSDILMP